MVEITKQQCESLIGTTVKGYEIIDAAIIDGQSVYGVALARSKDKQYVTWQWHISRGEPTFYWGHSFDGNVEAALHDFFCREQNPKTIQLVSEQTR